MVRWDQLKEFWQQLKGCPGIILQPAEHLVSVSELMFKR